MAKIKVFKERKGDGNGIPFRKIKRIYMKFYSQAFLSRSVRQSDYAFVITRYCSSWNTDPEKQRCDILGRDHHRCRIAVHYDIRP